MKDFFEKYGLEIIMLVFIIVVMFAGSIPEILTKNEYRITVTDKNIKRKSNNEDVYMIYTTLESGKIRTFKIDDSVVIWRFNSSDVYADIQVGTKYKVKTRGWRIPILSEYENIASYEVIQDE